MTGGQVHDSQVVGDVAQRILDALAEPVLVDGQQLHVTASIGVAMAVRGLGLSADEVLRHADTAMYRAKAAGRNCIAFFDDSMVEKVTQRLDIETALYRALDKNEVRLVHQPIVDTQLGVVIGFEALMRWDRGANGTVSPADFIPIAEETGTIVPLGSWVINEACRQAAEWQRQFPSLWSAARISKRPALRPNAFPMGVLKSRLWLKK